MQTVSVFMTRYNDILSNFVYWISGCGYTHVAINVDETSEDYYTFNYKGFRREHPFGRKRRYGSSICYKLEVTKEQQMCLKEIITQMENEMACGKTTWKYSLWGVVLCILGIRHKFRESYFCSQFVTELLEKSGIMKWRKHSSLYLPNHMCKELRKYAGLKETLLFSSIEVEAPYVEVDDPYRKASRQVFMLEQKDDMKK